MQVPSAKAAAAVRASTTTCGKRTAAAGSARGGKTQTKTALSSFIKPKKPHGRRNTSLVSKVGAAKVYVKPGDSTHD